MPASADYERWELKKQMSSRDGALQIFVISSIRGCRAGSIMSFLNTDIKKNIEVARDALRILIKEDNAK